MRSGREHDAERTPDESSKRCAHFSHRRRFIGDAVAECLDCGKRWPYPAPASERCACGQPSIRQWEHGPKSCVIPVIAPAPPASEPGRMGEERFEKLARWVDGHSTKSDADFVAEARRARAAEADLLQERDFAQSVDPDFMDHVALMAERAPDPTDVDD